MGATYGLLVVFGLGMIAFGIWIFKYPKFMWNISLARRWYLKGGEPTDLYYANQKISGVIYAIFGAVMILLGISMTATQARGYVVEIDGEKLRLPGTYTDIEALGYHIDAGEEIKTLQATEKAIKNSATYVVKNAEGKEITLTLENRGDADRPATECELIAISVENENGPKIKLPNGVKSGMSEKDVEAIWGRGTPKGIGGSAAEYKAKVNFNSYRINIVYDGNFMNRKVSSIRVTDGIY
ncbi:MAG: hypothetical protein IKY23_12940 [Lachnospiraceae bacterium]|nr:hypothetical protein [Lachnospiraceae bacterium]